MPPKRASKSLSASGSKIAASARVEHDPIFYELGVREMDEAASEVIRDNSIDVIVPGDIIDDTVRVPGPTNDFEPVPSLNGEDSASIQDVIRAAAGLISSSCGLETYLSSINLVRYVEKVLAWRLGIDNHRSVPAPFTPTPLQSRSLTHFMGIDFFSWSELRDQLLLEQDNLNLEDIFRDLILYSVIEIPHLNAAYNIFEIFHQQVDIGESNIGGGTPQCFLFDPTWVFFEVDFAANYPHQISDDLVENAIANELIRRLTAVRKTSKPPPSILPIQKFNDLTKIDGLIEETVLEDVYKNLPSVSVDTLIGKWKGGSFNTGHPTHKLLRDFRWAGKDFRSADDVDPIMLEDDDGNRIWCSQYGHARVSSILVLQTQG
ncbi:hypothetical protein G7Z17_g3426 [Cylindrodendrum hubeiense]|uniref:GXWXG domain-containing protein n=1 Tax=Cylindrodendrum hubeiense TaxID=595255 RepID=A0A9P5HGV7_9HYPO|nr:hypothetical protein G7Z17_g3426 [Cylindrodendrum hubeiense]